MLQGLLSGAILAGNMATVALPIDSVEVYYLTHDYAAVVRLVEAKESPPMHDQLLLGWSYYRLGQMERAKAAFENGLQIAPASLELLNGLAFAQYRLGQATAAETSFRAVLARSPERVESQRGLAFVLFTTQRFEECLPMFDAFWRQDGSDKEAEYHLVKSVDGLLSSWQQQKKTLAQMVEQAWQYEAAGNRRSAFEMFQWIVQVEPFHPGARLGLGTLGPSFGHEAEARAALESLLRENSKDGDARLALSRLHLQAGRSKEAEKELKRFLDAHPKDPRGEALRDEIAARRTGEAVP